MPWKECNRMNERMKFVIRLEDGERMTDLCREFEISRKTGYKIWNRYHANGVDGLFDESKRPYHNPRKTAEHIEDLILQTKLKRPTWGADKIREYLLKKSKFNLPSRNTFHNILLRNDLVKKRRRRRYKATGTNLTPSNKPNDLWCADFKGQFRMKNNKYCYPLTITDHESRFLLGCEALESVKEGGAFSVFNQAFEKFGVPKAIRTDNGFPFSCGNALLGLSRLSVWWLRLGIDIERITPGNPQENGRHERMHLTLKQDTLSNPTRSILSQQEVFEDFKKMYNFDRPHQALGNEMPGNIYTKSKKLYKKEFSELTYPDMEMEKKVIECGKVSFRNRKSIFISEVLAGEVVGITEVEEKMWKVKFMDLVLGHYDENEGKFSPMREMILEKV